MRQVVVPLIWKVVSVVAAAQPAVLVNQVGYRPGDPKIAFLKEMESRTFIVIDVSTQRNVFNGRVNPVGKRDTQTGDIVFSMDFSAVKTPGTYRIHVPSASVSSPEFRIGEDVYRSAVKRTVESFTFQRCGVVVGQGTPWFHPECHKMDGYFLDAPSLWRDVRGGWHDAGDYGKFVVTGALSAAFLLYAHEKVPNLIGDGELRLPEGSNGIPDILDEVRWELEWLLKMQVNDGGVFHKVSTKKWTGEYLPHLDPDPRFIFRVSSTATGSFAAVTALGARLFGRWDKPFARKLLKASLKSWEYLTINKYIIPPGGFKNPDGVEGGEYGDASDADERLWAAVELYHVTRGQQFHDYIRANFKSLRGFDRPVDWQNVQNFAYASYLHLPVNARDLQVAGYIASHLKASCKALVERIEAHPYRYVLRDNEFYWGSNSIALGYAFNLLLAAEITGDHAYANAALDQLHFMLGRNTFHQTFVTGVGDHPVRHPYHQFSMMLNVGAPVPGLVVGGPNRNSKLRGNAISPFPGKSYQDWEKNYFVNEVAINYTAPLVYLAAFFTNGLPQATTAEDQ